MIHLIGWIGNLGFLLGAIFLALKWKIGWHMQIIANILYTIYSLILGTEGFSLLFLSIALVGVNFYGLKNWSDSDWVKLR